jgi:Scavenger mRNA decapping enzyme C-term binding
MSGLPRQALAATYHMVLLTLHVEVDVALAVRQIRVGYHGNPSLRPLHLHVISQDLDGRAMKTLKHWNSFTTPFFCEVDVSGHQ